jgi:hypothetical protein
MSVPETWVPEACTLPTVEQPLRVAEFDELFSSSLQGQERAAPTRLTWAVDRAVEEQARDLAARESSCCSFFSFGFAQSASILTITVEVPPQHVDVLDSLEARATRSLASRA